MCSAGVFEHSKDFQFCTNGRVLKAFREVTASKGEDSWTNLVRPPTQGVEVHVKNIERSFAGAARRFKCKRYKDLSVEWHMFGFSAFSTRR